MKSKYLLLVALASIGVMFSCKKSATETGSSLRILKSPTGQNQSVSANIDNSGYVNFDPQTLLADGGSPLRNYTWSLESSPTPPAGITIEPLTGVINRSGHSSTGLKTGTTTFKVKVSDGSATRTESIDLIVTAYTPGPLAVFQQLTTAFQLKNGDANKPYGASLFVVGGVPPYSWSLDNTYAGSADLTNAGLTVEASAGIVRGTSLNSASGKVIKFKVKVTDNAGSTALNGTVYSIIVN